MTISIADAAALIQSKVPAPVILVDTCNFLHLFRSDQGQPRVPHQEIRAAADLLERFATDRSDGRLACRWARAKRSSQGSTRKA